jgi:transcriptional regulator with XRE-family HTH domain
MKLKDWLATEGITQQEIAAELRCDQAFISRLCARDKPLPIPRAITLYRNRGVKLDRLAGLSDEEIDVLDRVTRAAA